MAWTSIPVKHKTKNDLEELDEKNGRDWDTFIRRELLQETIDGNRDTERDTFSLKITEIADKIPEIQDAVDAVNSQTLTAGYDSDATIEVDGWLEYNIETSENPITGETEYHHEVDYSAVPSEKDGVVLDSRLGVWLQKQLNHRGFFIMYVIPDQEVFSIQHTDLILRRIEAGVPDGY